MAGHIAADRPSAAAFGMLTGTCNNRMAGEIADSGALMMVVSIRRRAAGLVAAAAGTVLVCLAPTGALAQFGSIFGDPPPRPPASVPGGRQPSPQQQQQQFPDRLPPGPPPSARRAPQPVQSEPLPPPPGVRQQDAAQPPGLPPNIRPPRGTPAPAVTTPQPGDEVVAAPPSQKIPNQTAVFSGLDKITGRIISFDVTLGETVQFGALQVVPRVCYTRPPTEAAATDAFVEVSEVTLQGEVRRIFSGWMFAASPGLNAVEHPIYDVWLTDCKQPTAVIAEQPAPPQLGLQGPPQVIPETETAEENPQSQPSASTPPQAPRPRPQQAQQPQQPQRPPQPQAQRPRPQPQTGGANPFPTPIR
jgi:hypothetical protein